LRSNASNLSVRSDRFALRRTKLIGCLYPVPECSDRLRSPFLEFCIVVFMVFFCALPFVSFYRPLTKKTAKQGGSRESSPEGTAKAPCESRSGEGERMKSGAEAGPENKLKNFPRLLREADATGTAHCLRMRHDRCASSGLSPKLNRAIAEWSVPCSRRNGCAMERGADSDLESGFLLWWGGSIRCELCRCGRISNQTA
jgi:hypothetical protein